MNLIRFASFVVTTILPPLPAQQLWKVNSGGSFGAHFTDLPPAVLAASPGDTILIYHDGMSGGTYTAATIDKGLTIVGFSIIGGSLSCRGVFTITGIPAGQRVVLSNLYIPHGATFPALLTFVWVPARNEQVCAVA